MKAHALAAATGALIVFAVQAEPSAVDSKNSNAPIPDPRAPAQQIVQNGAGGAAAACFGCHGANGEGNAAAGFPKLAAQSGEYLENQLRSYATGTRLNAVMTPIAKSLTDEQRAAVAAYYATLPPVRTTPAKGAEVVSLGRGQTIAQGGDAKLRVQACANCHGPDGVGIPPVYPTLANQHREYLASALTEWKNGQRNTDPSSQMMMIARALPDRDIAALAAYYARTPPPPAYADRLRTLPKAARSTPVPSGPVGPAATPTGQGASQGTPTSGNQGQAGGVSSGEPSSGAGSGRMKSP